MPLDIVKYSPRVQKFSTRGRTGGTGPPIINLKLPKISETTRARMLKLKTQLHIVKYSLWVKKISPLGVRAGGVGPPSVDLGPP